MSTQSERVASLAAEGLPQRDIARLLGIGHQRVSTIVREHGIECVRAKPQRKFHRKLSEQTVRIINSAPALAKRGLSKAEAARKMGVTRVAFTQVVLKHLPDIEWRNGREHSGVTKRIVQAAPALARRGLSKADAARELGVPASLFNAIVHKNQHDTEWRDGREDGKGGIPPSRQTKRIRDAAPELAERGLSKAEAARKMGVTTEAFVQIVKCLPDIEWRDGRERSGVSKRIVQAAPALARRGLSKADVAREFGVSPAHLAGILRRHLPDTQWRDGRERAPSTVKDDERFTMRRVMAETLAGVEQTSSRENAGIER